jgi:D-alanyl-D-alanine carboxypeptidase (penicillin-binding protein 5/6)
MPRLTFVALPVALGLLLSACESPSSSTGQTAYAPSYAPAGAPASYAPPPSQAPFSSGSEVHHGEPSIRAACYFMVNPDNGDVLAARNADMPHAVASTQKVLTALVVVEDGNLDKLVRIEPSDINVEPSKLGVRPGDTYTRRELVTAFLVKSANDVANALARDNAGSISAFAAKMNARAREAGAYNSHFENPHGLTASGQYSTARDMARIALAAYHNPVIRAAVCQRYHTFHYASGRTTTLENTNELLGKMPACDGMKTGYTGPAGRCLISTAHHYGRDVLLVQLGTKTKYIWDDGAAMMSWGLMQ